MREDRKTGCSKKADKKECVKIFKAATARTAREDTVPGSALGSERDEPHPLLAGLNTEVE